MTSMHLAASAPLYADAQRGIATAVHLGHPVPDQYAAAVECVSAARKLAAEPPPSLRGDLTADKLVAEVRKIGRARVEHDAVVAAAREAEDNAMRTALVCFRQHLPGYIDTLAADYRDTVAQFATSRAAAPTVLGANDTDEQIAAFVAMTRSAANLDNLAGARYAFAQTVNEPGLHPSVPWYLFTAPAEPARRQVLSDVLHEIRTSHTWQERTPVERWSTLHACADLGMATLNATQPRIEAWGHGQHDNRPMMTGIGQGQAVTVDAVTLGAA